MSDPGGCKDDSIEFLDIIIDPLMVIQRKRSSRNIDDTIGVISPQRAELYDCHLPGDGNQRKLVALGEIQVSELDVRPLHDTSSSPKSGLLSNIRSSGGLGSVSLITNLVKR